MAERTAGRGHRRRSVGCVHRHGARKGARVVTEPAYVEATRQWCNERRAEKGMEPLEELPKGRMLDPGSCPCGLATGLRVGYRCYWLPDEEREDDENAARLLDGLGPLGRELPDAVKAFTHAFDRG